MAFLKGLHVAVRLGPLTEPTGRPAVLKRKGDDRPGKRQELPQQPQQRQEQGRAAQRRQLGQADAPGVAQVDAPSPPQVRLGLLRTDTAHGEYAQGQCRMSMS